MKIREKIELSGLQTYLNTTTNRHNGFDYIDFIKLVDSGMTKTSIGRAFQVDRRTIDVWIEMLNIERQKTSV